MHIRKLVDLFTKPAANYVHSAWREMNKKSTVNNNKLQLFGNCVRSIDNQRKVLLLCILKRVYGTEIFSMVLRERGRAVGRMVDLV